MSVLDDPKPQEAFDGIAIRGLAGKGAPPGGPGLFEHVAGTNETEDEKRP